MITAEQTRNMMPNLEKVVKRLQSAIVSRAEQAHTNVDFRFFPKEKALMSPMINILTKAGYTTSYQGDKEIRVSWKKLD